MSCTYVEFILIFIDTLVSGVSPMSSLNIIPKGLINNNHVTHVNNHVTYNLYIIKNIQYMTTKSTCMSLCTCIHHTVSHDMYI